MILSCHHLAKAYGETVIIKDATFGIEAHEKCALVGINGAGKSTILKMITGELEKDSGEVILAHGKTLGYLAQQDMTVGKRTIYEELEEAKRPLLDLEEKIRETEIAMKEASGEDLEALMNQYHRLTTDFEEGGGYALRSEITGVLKGLGFTPEEFSKKTETLSGGQRTRVALGRLLLYAPDIILLDEPTNHLDIGSITWLEGYLASYPGAAIIVSHDRYFLNRVVSKVVEVENGTVMSFAGDYTAYSHRKKEIREAKIKAWLNQQQQIRHQEEVITKLRSFNREKSIRRAESREKMLSKIDRLEKPVDPDTRIHLDLTPESESGNDVLAVEGLAKSFGNQLLFSDLDLFIRRGERVALIGDNGTGKTTILKIINGLLDADAGTVTLGARVQIGYYDQEHQVLHAEKTLFEEISDEYPDLSNTRIRNVLAAFLFTGDDVYKLVGELSGGERGRVALAKLMLSHANFLILDEPTNHLDIESKEILEAALTRYTGTILYVSHDRYFINETCTRIVALKDTSLTQYLGNYDYYAEKAQQLSQNASSSAADTREPTRAGKAPSPAHSDPAAANAASLTPAAGGKENWQKSKEEQARLRKKQNDLKRTEDSIAALEQADKEIDAQLSQEEIFTDQKKCHELTLRKADIAAQLESLYEKWEELAE